MRRKSSTVPSAIVHTVKVAKRHDEVASAASSSAIRCAGRGNGVYEMLLDREGNLRSCLINQELARRFPAHICVSNVSHRHAGTESYDTLSECETLILLACSHAGLFPCAVKCSQVG